MLNQTCLKNTWIQNLIDKHIVCKNVRTNLSEINYLCLGQGNVHNKSFEIKTYLILYSYIYLLLKNICFYAEYLSRSKPGDFTEDLHIKTSIERSHRIDNYLLKQDSIRLDEGSINHCSGVQWIFCVEKAADVNVSSRTVSHIFQCISGENISDEYKCYGQVDCVSKEDETNSDGHAKQAESHALSYMPRGQ